jgi:competence protein ComEC
MKKRYEEVQGRHFSWKEMPMARLVLALAPGIPVGIFSPISPEQVALTGMGIFGSGCLWLSRKKIPFRYRYIYGCCCLLFWFCAGVWIGHRSVSLNTPSYFLQQAIRDPVWLAKVEKVSTAGYPSAVMEIHGYWENGDWENYRGVKGKLLAYSEADQTIREGQLLLLRGTIREIPGPKNPMAFDNKRYRFFQNIHHQIRLRAGEYLVIGQEETAWYEQWRKQQIEWWKGHLPDPAVFSVASAMVLGYKAELPEDVRETYAQTGASHVLAVSGLHVGLIYLILSSIVGRLKWRPARIVISLAGIWGFALVTGATPSVVRAATMFSFVLVGQQLRRPISVFNSLAASAFLLLLIQPLWLFHIGFQLSYSAVLGIVVFQPRWYQLWIPPNGWLDKIWTLITVSLAAQMATLPLTLFYFHQFPVYFWLSGLIVVPAAPFIIGLGLALIVLQAIYPQWCWLPAEGLNGLIRLINFLLELIQNWPGSLITGIYLPVVGLLLLMLSLIMLGWIWERSMKKYLFIFLLLLNGAAVTRCIAEVKYFIRPKWIVYSIYGHTLVDYLHRGRLWTWKSGSLPEEREERVAGPYRKRHRIYLKKATVIPERFAGKIVHPDLAEMPHFLLISGNPSITGELAEVQDAALWVIADGSNKKWALDKWEQLCREKGWTFVDTGETGAWEQTFSSGPEIFSLQRSPVPETHPGIR